MSEIVFLVEDAIEGGFIARALDHAIYTEAENRVARSGSRCSALPLRCTRAASPHPAAQLKDEVLAA